MSKKSAASKAPTGRVSGVSAKILELLAGGSKSTSDLIAEGGFSAAGAFLNLKKLKAAGAVVTERAGRAVHYSLADGASLQEAAPRRGRKKASMNKAADKPGRKAKASKAASPSASKSLAAELAAIADRFRPNADLDRQLDVLDNLVSSMPASVARVLGSIRAELVRRG